MLKAPLERFNNKKKKENKGRLSSGNRVAESGGENKNNKEASQSPS